MDSTKTWTIVDGRAQFSVGGMSADFDLSSPSSGLTLRWNNSVVAERLFAIVVNDEPVESVVRLNDLIVRLPNRNSDLVSYEFCFRADPQGHSIDLLLSAQTNLLDSRPETKVVTDFVQGQVFAQHRSDFQSVPESTNYNEVVEYFLVRKSEEHSLVLMNHPTDFHEAGVHLGDGDEPTITYSVFPVSLEKGVIRRARFRLRMIDRDQDQAQAAKYFSEFAEEAPPLAT